MQKFNKKVQNSKKGKLKLNPLNEPIIKEELLPFFEIELYSLHTRKYFFTKINKNLIFEDEVLGKKIKFNIIKKNKKYYLNKKEFDKIKEIYSEEKKVHSKLLDYNSVIKKSNFSINTLRASSNKEYLYLLDKLLQPHKIKKYFIGNKNYVSKEDINNFLKHNSNIYLLSDFSEELFNIKKKSLWKKIKKDEEGYYFIIKGKNNFRVSILKNEKNIYYLNKETYFECKNLITKRNNEILDYVPFKEGIKNLNLPFKSHLYRSIKNNEFRFLLNGSLIKFKVFRFNESFYFNKNEYDLINSPTSENKYYSLSSFLSLFKSINYEREFKKQVCNKNKDFKFTLKFDNFSINISVLVYKNKPYFSKSTLNSIYGFVKLFKQKLENKTKISYLIKEKKINKKYKRYLNEDSNKLISKTKKIAVHIFKINNQLYYNNEDEEKIIKLLS